MELKHFVKVTDEKYLEQIYELLSMYDKDFVPPLSGRSSTTQASLSGASQAKNGVKDYFDMMIQQDMVLALEDDRVAGLWPSAGTIPVIILHGHPIYMPPPVWCIRILGGRS